MPTIATLASHTALQILKGAKDEGFPTLAIATPQHANMYKHVFPVADEVMPIDDYHNFFAVEKELIEKDAIIIPHGSFVAYLDHEAHKRMQVRYYGNKDILGVEADRELQRQWLLKAGCTLPKPFLLPEDIDRPIIVKFYGAGGGRGYFFVKDRAEFEQRVDALKISLHEVTLQEYIVGCPIYFHYFYSPLDDRLEIMSIDRRYETTVDSLGRIPSRNQAAMELDPSFVVIGNTPVVLRESLLTKVYEMGRRVIEVSKEICPPRGLFGPFCLECVATPTLDFYVIEISGRIVAGTNIYINGSPYTDLVYDVPMSTGRRIAVEIKRAIQQGRLDEIC